MRGYIAPIVMLSFGCGSPTYPPAVVPAHPLLARHLPAMLNSRTVEGKPFDASQLASRPVLVKFFADYCKPCKDTLPAAERVHQAYPNTLFVGIDEDDTVETANAVVQRFGLTFPVIHDAANVLSGRFRVTTMPMTFVADSTGVIRWVGGEHQTEDDIRRAVEAAR
jgi:thiol-disulfide isomerase/thioredoxin